jgi:tetratricopeptide (TPR) repeat protein
VEELRRKGELQAALLKLDELARLYPGEAHGYILQAEILQQMGVIETALANYVAGIRLDGDYVDKKSPLSRREEISRFVTEAEGTIGSKAAANPSNRTLAVARKDLNYLKSRLAGGCE